MNTDTLYARRDPASFRDPSGFVFRSTDGTLLRQINRPYEEHFSHLMNSGLHESLVADEMLVEHEPHEGVPANGADALCFIRPRELAFKSYPYEWSFSALKDAALLTLRIQRRALRHGMTLKDASAYNVQFDGTAPIFIDTLSFEKSDPGQPWKAYAQFCRHFLAPLALMAHRDVRLHRLLTLFIDGIPLELACKLLPMRSRISPGLVLHLFVQARFLKMYEDTSRVEAPTAPRTRKTSPLGLEAILDSLEKTITKLRCKIGKTEWGNYYQDNSYTGAAFEKKKTMVRNFLSQVQPGVVWDLGANTGVFSELACESNARTYAFDIDPACIESAYIYNREKGRRNILPLLLDLTNPTPALGWAHQERASFSERGPADAILALALIHHLAISNNVPLDHIAGFLAGLCRYLIIEFVPKNDVQVQRLLQGRDDIFDEYDRPHFEAAFQRHFKIIQREEVEGNGRILYLMSTSPDALATCR